tara:strand:- start:283 stop:1011 length:729 start_codon:yes stop_codon:yes gene_type:complete
MKNKLLILALLLLSSCASFQVSTLNHDPIYIVEGSNTEINVISNRFELNRFLRNDFNFRYNFAQYALSQPPSFDWHFNRYNRFNRFNRYNRFNSYYGYSSLPWHRNQMWNNWIWNHPYSSNIGWSYYQNTPYGWDNYFSGINRYLRNNQSYYGSRRENNTNTNRRRTNTQPVTITTTSRRIVINKKPRKVIRNTSNSTLRTNTRRRIPLARTPIRVNTPTRTIRVVSNNTQPTRKVNSRRKN